MRFLKNILNLLCDGNAKLTILSNYKNQLKIFQIYELYKSVEP